MCMMTTNTNHSYEMALFFLSRCWGNSLWMSPFLNLNYKTSFSRHFCCFIFILPCHCRMKRYLSVGYKKGTWLFSSFSSALPLFIHDVVVYMMKIIIIIVVPHDDDDTMLSAVVCWGWWRSWWYELLFLKSRSVTDTDYLPHQESNQLSLRPPELL